MPYSPLSKRLEVRRTTKLLKQISDKNRGDGYLLLHQGSVRFNGKTRIITQARLMFTDLQISYIRGFYYMIWMQEVQED